MTNLDPDARPPRPAPRRSPWRLLIQVLVVLAIAGLVAIGMKYCVERGAQSGSGGPAAGGGGPRGAARAGGPGGGRPPAAVGVAKAALGDIPIQIQALGTVTSLATVNVNARVSGLLEKVTFTEGQAVRAGQLLALIDPRPFQVALDQAQAQMVRDQALLDNARLDLKRYQTLNAQDSISAQTVATQMALVRQYEATVAADRAGVDSAKLNLSFTRITSPVTGRIGLRQVDAGNQITANQSTPFAVVTQLTPIAVTFAVPEPAIASIAHGGAGLPVTAFDRAGGKVVARGVLETLDNVIDTTTGTVKAKARFENADNALFPNQFVAVTLLVDTLRRQVVTPTAAVRHGPNGDFVWVVSPKSTVSARPVKAGPGTADQVSIVSGLNVGETVVVDGGDRLREDAQVRLPGSPGPGGDTAGSAPREGPGGARPGAGGRAGAG
jgi:multidrug efflux system membrane fusion protein